MAQTKHDRFRDLMERAGIPLPRPHRIPRRAGPRECEASYAQRRIWIDQMLDSANTAYNILLAMRVEGPLPHAATAQALQTIVDRHEALRTCFRTVGGKPHQIASARLPVDVSLVDLTGHEDRLHAVLGDVQRTRFSLDRCPLFAFTVVRLARHVHVVAMVLHHIVFDFVSSQVLCDEFGRLYARYTAGLPNALPELRIQYMDCSDWQRTQFEQPSGAAVLKAWQEAIGTGDDVQITELPGDVPSAREAFRPAVERFAIPVDVSRRVAQSSREFGTSAFCVWLAAFQLLLQRYTDADDIVLCVPHAQRDDPDAERLIGCFVNLIVVRARVRPQDSFRTLLRAVRDDYLDAVSARACPFDKLVEALAPTRREGQPRLGDIAFAYQRGARSTWSVGPLHVSMLETGVANAKLAFSMSLYENPEQCRGLVEYNGARFSRRMAREMAGHYCDLLSSLLMAPDRPVGSIAHRVAASGSRSARNPSLPAQDCLHLAFERQARTTPDAAALVVGDIHLTYRGLNRRANQLARRLVREGIGVGSAVGLRLRRDLDAYIYALAIFKAGGVYVPMDPSHPAAYSLKAIDTAAIAHVIVDERDVIPAGVPCRSTRTLHAAAMLETSGDEDDRDLDLPASGAHTAYVYFTSGSTGESKGVPVSHGAIASHMQAFLRALPMQASDRVLQFAALTFDVSLEQMFSAWLSGATLLPRGDEIWSARECIDFLRREQVTVANPPTAYWNQVVRAGTQTGMLLPDGALRYMIAGGEAMLAEAARRWHRMSTAGVGLINAYGPTEAVVTATCHDVSDPDACESGTSVPIGLPLEGVFAYVLDRHGSCVPVGAPGELCLAGVALAHGYLRNPRLTAEKFCPVPDDGQEDRRPAGTRLYRTGDWVRQSADGVIEYLGRKDDEVKIRGVRVTTTRIESVLLEREGIAEAAVVVRERQVPRHAAPPSIDEDSQWRDMLERLPAAFVEASIEEAERDDQRQRSTSAVR